VRCDVIILGPRLDEALKLFVDVVLTDMEDLMEVPVFFVDGVTFSEAPSRRGQGEGL
jgi:hypothetical protein